MAGTRFHAASWLHHFYYGTQLGVLARDGIAQINMLPHFLPVHSLPFTELVFQNLNPSFMYSTIRWLTVAASDPADLVLLVQQNSHG